MKTKAPKPPKDKVKSIFSDAENSKISKEEKSTSPAPDVQLTTRTPKTGPERKTVAWYEEDGKIDWSRMRSASQDTLREFLQRPDVWEGLKIEKKAEIPSRELIKSDTVAAAYELLGKIEVFLAQRATGCSQELAEKVCLFDEEDERMLVPATVKLINKRGPDWFALWNEEVEFGFLFLSIQMQKIFILKKLAKKETQARRDNAPAPAPVLLIPKKPPVETEPEEPESPESPVDPEPVAAPPVTDDTDTQQLHGAPAPLQEEPELTT
jgi:hypothetical protein